MGSNPKKKFRFVIKVIIILFIIACAVPFFIKDKKGRPFISFQKIKTGVYVRLVELKHLLKLDTIPEAETDKITEAYIPYKDKEYTEMYKYRDEKGVLHFTDQKPKNLNYEVLYMPKSKEPGVVKEMMDKVFTTEKSGRKSSLSRLSEIQKSDNSSGGKALSPGDILSKTKEILRNATGQYKEAPNALKDAKELKEQVGEVYRERDKMIEER